MITGMLTPPKFLQMEHEKILHDRLVDFKEKGIEYLQKEC